MLFAISASLAWAEDVAGSANAGTTAPVDCPTAKDDLAKLEEGKLATSDKAVDGILGYTPVGIVTNVAAGGDTMDEEQKVEAEAHNKEIDGRIADIKAACGDALAPAPTLEWLRTTPRVHRGTVKVRKPHSRSRDYRVKAAAPMCMEDSIFKQVVRCLTTIRSVG